MPPASAETLWGIHPLASGAELGPVPGNRGWGYPLHGQCYGDAENGLLLVAKPQSAPCWFGVTARRSPGSGSHEQCGLFTNTRALNGGWQSMLASLCPGLTVFIKKDQVTIWPFWRSTNIMIFVIHVLTIYIYVSFIIYHYQVFSTVVILSNILSHYDVIIVIINLQNIAGRQQPFQEKGAWLRLQLRSLHHSPKEKQTTPTGLCWKPGCSRKLIVE